MTVFVLTSISSAREFQNLANESSVVRNVTIQAGTYHNLNLENVRFELIKIERAVFVNCQFEQSVWEQSELLDVRFEHCSFEGATIRHSHWQHISGVQFDASHTMWEQCSLTEVDWRQANIDRSNWLQCEWDCVMLPMELSGLLAEQCRFHQLHVEPESHWHQVLWEHCCAPEAAFKHVTLTQVAFTQCNLENSDFSGVKAPCLSLWRTQATKSLFYQAQLNEAILEQCQLNGADFSAANLEKSCLVGAQLQQAVLARACLNYADLSHAQLQWADLETAQLLQTNLHAAQLQGAILPLVDNPPWRGDDLELRHAEQWQPDPGWLKLISSRRVP